MSYIILNTDYFFNKYENLLGVGKKFVAFFLLDGIKKRHKLFPTPNINTNIMDLISWILNRHHDDVDINIIRVINSCWYQY